MTALRWTFWSVMAFLSIGVAGYAFFHVATQFVNLPPPIKQNGFPSPLGLETHIAASGVALLLGPFQFLPGLRRTQPRVHRWMGTIYVLACLIGGAAGGSVALFSTSGPIAGWGFLGLAVAWFGTTSMAFIKAKQRDFTSHERWMIRSFALTLAAVTLRLYLPIGLTIDPTFTAPYRIIAWACWVPNLLIAELWLMTKRRPKPKAAAAAA
jgi:hypothetical protein